MIKDRVIGKYVTKIDDAETELKEGLVLADSWEKVLALQNRIHGLRSAKELLNSVLEEEDK